MLIKLYPAPAAPDTLRPLPAGAQDSPDADSAAQHGADTVQLRKPIGLEHDGIIAWVAQQFSPGWAGEVRVALANRPVTLWIAARDHALLGFACFDATALGFFGPIGVATPWRGLGLGAELLRACLYDMRSAGYGYAVAGAVGAPELFRRVAGATEIADSTPGWYAQRLAP